MNTSQRQLSKEKHWKHTIDTLQRQLTKGNTGNKQWTLYKVKALNAAFVIFLKHFFDPRNRTHVKLNPKKDDLVWLSI